MSRIKTESFLRTMRDRVDELCLSVPEIETKSGIHNSVIYRILEGSRETVDRATLRRLANALEMDYMVKGDWATLTKQRTVEDVNQVRGGDSLRDLLNDMYKDFSAAHLESVQKFARIIVTMDHAELVDFNEACDALDMDKNKGVFLEKLKAFVKIVTPYETVKKQQRSEEG